MSESVVNIGDEFLSNWDGDLIEIVEDGEERVKVVILLDVETGFQGTNLSTDAF